jgi:glycosyltransferase involved in cell wall biosynthesis
MKIGYFTHTNVSPSETFIFDLIKELNKDSSFNLEIFGGKKKHLINYIENLSVISTGFSERGYKTSFKLFKIGQALGNERGFLLKNQYQQKSAYKALSKTIKKEELPEVGYIDYGTSAVLCYKFLSDNNIPFIVHVHGYDITSALNDKVYKAELEKVFSKASFFIAASNYIRKLLILAGCPEEKIKVIRYGLDATKCKPMDWENRKRANPSVIFLGRLTAKKHPIALLHAFKLVKEKVPEAQLTIIGGGELETEVKKTINKLGLSNSVKMLGVLNREQSFPILNQHWVYAQHSVTAKSCDQEGFAISLAEAALHEIPVVSTYHNGIPENVIDGKTGLLVKEFDFEAMAEKIIYLIQNPEIAEKMGKAGREHIMELCEPGKRVNKIKELLYEAAGK